MNDEATYLEDEPLDELPPVEDLEPIATPRLGPFHSDGMVPRPHRQPMVWTTHEILHAWAGEDAGIDSADMTSLDRPTMMLGASTSEQAWLLVRSLPDYAEAVEALRAVYGRGQRPELHQLPAILAIMSQIEQALKGWKPSRKFVPTSRAEEIANIQAEVERARQSRPIGWRNGGRAL